MPLKINGLRKFREQISDAQDRGVDRAADFVVDLAQQLAPVDEGDLESTIRKEGAPGSRQRQVKAGGIAGSSTGKPVDYAEAVEYGTRDSPAQPFLTPAVEAIDLKAEIKKEVQDLIESCRI